MDASNAQIISRQWFVEKWKKRPSDGHKGTFGHLLLIAGHEGMVGAAVLAARAALRSGVGKVTVHIPRCGRDILQITVPEAVLQIDEGSDRCWSSLIDPTPFSAIAVGPGLGTDGETTFALRSLLKQLLELDTEGKAPALILDADALNLCPPTISCSRSCLPAACSHPTSAKCSVCAKRSTYPTEISPHCNHRHNPCLQRLGSPLRSRITSPTSLPQMAACSSQKAKATAPWPRPAAAMYSPD